MIHEAWHNAPSIEIDLECPKLHLKKPLRIGPFASIGFPGLGFYNDGIWSPKDHPFGVIVLEGAVLNSHVTIHRGSWRDTFIGRNVRLGSYCNIGHNVQIGNNVLVSVSATVLGSTEVGDSAVIWSGATIRQRLKIGEGAVVGMGAVVTKDVESYTTVVGNPARRLG